MHVTLCPHLTRFHLYQWKAAKEELHGDEDEDEEPENAYEVLERKRLKEIEVCTVRYHSYIFSMLAFHL